MCNGVCRMAPRVVDLEADKENLESRISKLESRLLQLAIDTDNNIDNWVPSIKALHDRIDEMQGYVDKTFFYISAALDILKPQSSGAD